MLASYTTVRTKFGGSGSKSPCLNKKLLDGTYLKGATESALAVMGCDGIACCAGWEGGCVVDFCWAKTFPALQKAAIMAILIRILFVKIPVTSRFKSSFFISFLTPVLSTAQPLKHHCFCLFPVQAPSRLHCGQNPTLPMPIMLHLLP